MRDIITLFLINLILFIPLLILASKQTRDYVKYYMLVYFLDCIALFLGPLLIPNIYNFIGKIISILISLIFVNYLVRRTNIMSLEDLHITKGSYQNSKKLITISALILLSFALTYFINRVGTFSWEEVIFQATLPGPDEELLFRSLGLGLLLKVFPKNEKNYFRNIAFWFIAIQFGLMHALPAYTTTGNLIHSVNVFFITGLISVLFELITLKTKSILVPIILHNSYNTLLVILTLF